jgi:(p)ppGpp synthase/HD superfamily hydrolase
MLDAKGDRNDAKLAQEFTGMLLAMADVRAVLVKLADRLLNLRNTDQGAGLEAAAHEALDIFAPLANRLGVWSIKAEMEDLAFQVRRSTATSRDGRTVLGEETCIKF